MLRKPGSMYTHSRTNSMMKIKPYPPFIFLFSFLYFDFRRYLEMEVKVVEVHKGVLIAESPEGQKNSIRCPPQVIQNPPLSGSVITVKCILFISHIFLHFFQLVVSFGFRVTAEIYGKIQKQYITRSVFSSP